MRFFALYDTEGHILHVVGSPPDAPVMMPKASEPEQAVTEIVLPEELRTAFDSDGHAVLRRLIENFRVDPRPAQVAELRYLSDERGS